VYVIEETTMTLNVIPNDPGHMTGTAVLGFDDPPLNCPLELVYQGPAN
ncbi:MAG: hypothetical protein IH587_05990, partial [Anaerolineae bacterium]|nr:hypothetical protein [Anaerolineae bacterium]